MQAVGAGAAQREQRKVPVSLRILRPRLAAAHRSLPGLLGTRPQGTAQPTPLLAPTAKLALALRRLQQMPTKSRSPHTSPGLSGLRESVSLSPPVPPVQRPAAAGTQPRQRPRAAPGAPARPPEGDPRDLRSEPRSERLWYQGCLAPSPWRKDMLSGPSAGTLRCAAAAPTPSPPRKADLRSC